MRVSELTVLAVEGCPNAPLLHQRLAGLLVGSSEARISLQVVGSAEEAAHLGMHGSPTLLIDGIDPFPVPEEGPALACRLYPSDDGGLDGAPSVRALHLTLKQAGLAR